MVRNLDHPRWGNLSDLGEEIKRELVDILNIQLRDNVPVGSIMNSGNDYIAPQTKSSLPGGNL